jgi:hypothetical protein
MKKFFEFDIYREDTDPAVHQVGKLVLTSVGAWLTSKLIEVAYNSHFGLDKEKDNKNNA